VNGNQKPDGLEGYTDDPNASVNVSLVALPPATWRGIKFPPPVALKKSYVKIPLLEPVTK
jgi:hypothetical protein